MKKQIVQYVDDFDGEVLEGEGQTVAFGFDGRDYEIDLSDANRARLSDALAPFIRKARAVSGNRPRSTRASIRPGSASGDLQAIRQWAQSNGHKVADRGRIPNDVREAFERANS